MMSRTVSSRLSWALLALVQMFVAAAVPLADARLGAEEPRAAHVESESSAACAIQHDHLYCQLCRVADVAAPEPGRDRVGVPCAPLRPTVDRWTASTHAPGGPDLHLAGPRAPPSA